MVGQDNSRMTLQRTDSRAHAKMSLNKGTRILPSSWPRLLTWYPWSTASDHSFLGGGPNVGFLSPATANEGSKGEREVVIIDIQKTFYLRSLMSGLNIQFRPLLQFFVDLYKFYISSHLFIFKITGNNVLINFQSNTIQT